MAEQEQRWTLCHVQMRTGRSPSRGGWIVAPPNRSDAERIDETVPVLPVSEHVAVVRERDRLRAEVQSVCARAERAECDLDSEVKRSIDAERDAIAAEARLAEVTEVLARGEASES